MLPGSTAVLGLSALVLALLVQLSTQTEDLYSGDDICRLIKSTSKIRKPGTCDKWITCKDYKTNGEGTCTGSKPYFNPSKGDCNKALDAKDTYCAHTCTSSTQGYVSTSRNCAHWYYCEKKTSKGTGSCSEGMYFDQGKQMCVYPKDTTCDAHYELCDIVSVNVKILDEHHCNRYITCKDYKPVSNVCVLGNYYDLATGDCVDKKLVDCEKHPVPDEACGNKKLAVRDKFVGDGATCRGYFYCRDLGSGIPDINPTWLQCPVDRFFNEERQGCFPRASQKCVEDRCDGRQSGREVAEVKGCQHYVECVNEKEGIPFKCDDDKYFDAELEECTTEVKSYAACAI